MFSVVIPTMNRPRLLAAAVETVLWQTFEDLELIVSDNSTTESFRTQNQAVVERHAGDPRVRYICPRTWMNMPDHWEFASRHALGRYIVILTDRHVLRPSSLECLSAAIARLKDDGLVVSWHSESTFNTGVVRTGAFTGATELMESQTVISDFARFANWRSSLAWFNRLPRMLNSCYRSDIAGTIRAKHGRLFMPLAPDYTAGYLLLAYTRRVAYLDRPLMISYGNQSNGRKSLIYGADEYLTSLGDIDLFAGTPAPLRTVTNFLVRDLMMVRAVVGEKYPPFNLDLPGYYMCNYRELMYMQRIGSLVDVRSLYAQWWDAVRLLSSEEREKITRYVKELEVQRVPFTRLRRLAVRLELDGPSHSIVDAVRKVRQQFAEGPVYRNVLEAARETDYMISVERAI